MDSHYTALISSRRFEEQKSRSAVAPCRVTVAARADTCARVAHGQVDRLSGGFARHPIEIPGADKQRSPPREGGGEGTCALRPGSRVTTR